MSGKNRLKKRQTEYLNAKGIFANAKKDDPFYAEKLAVAESLGAITEKIGIEETISPDEMKNLAELYKDVLDKFHNLAKKTLDYFDSGKTVFSGYEAMKQQIAQNDYLLKKIDKDFKAITKAAENNEEKTLNDIFETSRVNSNYEVLPSEDRKASHGAQNERIPVTLKDKTTGATISGYFTPDNVVKDKKTTLKETYNKAKEKWGAAADFLDEIDFDDLRYDISNCQPSLLTYIMDNQEELSFMPYKEAYSLITKNAADFDSYKDISKYINTPEKLKIFLDVAKPVFLASNTIIINETVGIKAGRNTNRRNAAMSEIAALLGRPNLLASSENVKFNLDGQEMKGTFMKEAVGEDRGKAKIDSDFMKVGPESLNELEFKKALADMQILDYICGNPDRHTGNMLYSLVKNPDGTISLKLPQGIDNDTCLGTNMFDGVTTLNAVRLEDINIITKEMAEKVLALTPDKLRQSLYGFKLGVKEIENAVNRLNKLQKKIITDQKTYSEGYSKGYLIPKTIKVVDDEELNELRINEDLRIKRGGRNIFNRAVGVADSKNRVEMAEVNAKKQYYEAAYDATTGGLGKLNEIIDKMNKDHKITDMSPKYKEMLKNMETLKKMIVEIKGPIAGSKVDLSNGHVEGIKKIKEQMEKTIGSVYDYRDYKYNKTKGEEWREADPGHKVTREERRFNHSTDALNFLADQIDKFGKLDKELENYNAVQANKGRLIEEGKKRAEKYSKSDTVKRQNEVYKKNMLQNHISRSEFKTLKAFEQLEKAKKPEDKGIFKVQFDMMIGFSVNGLRQEDREAFKKKISEETGIEINEPDDVLLKKAVASHLVLTKYKCQKSEPGDRTKEEDKILKNLKTLDIKDPEKAVNILMNNTAYDKFFKMNEKEFIAKDAEQSPTVSIPSLKNTSKFTDALVDEVKKQKQQVKVEEKVEKNKGQVKMN